MKALKILGIVVGVIVLLGFGAATMFGYVPAVSNLIGLNKPKDLGITTTQADTDSGLNKFGVELVPQTDTGNASLRYEGQKSIDTTITDEELTALINNNKWIYMPVKNVQLKIGADGLIESTGTLRMNKLSDYLAATTGESVDTSAVNPYIAMLPAEVPYSISGYASVSNNAVTFTPRETRIAGLLATPAYAAGNNASGDVSSMSVGWFNIANSILSQYKAQISSFLTAIRNAIPNASVNATFSGGQMKIKGTVPAKKYTTNE